MKHADLIIRNSGQLVTCASGGKPKRGVELRDVGIIENGAVAIADGKFVGVGTTQSILTEFDAGEVIDADGRVVCPGFVDSHTHLVYAGDRLDEFELKIKGADYLDILAKGGGILSTVRATREASFEELVDLASTRLDKMLACGTTTCEIKTGYGLSTESELKMLAVIGELDRTHHISIVPTFLAAHTLPPEFNSDGGSYIDLICEEMLPLAWEWYVDSHFPAQKRPFFADVFCERNAFDLEQTVRVFQTAKKLGFMLKAHVDQFNNFGGSRLSIVENAISIDHLDAISDDEIDMLAASETVGIVIPTENFNAGKTTYANARKLIDSGCAVAVSTDYNPGSAPCPSLPMAMSIACRYQKLLPSEALNAATTNAAFGIGLGQTYGSIEVGGSADLAMLDCSDYRMLAYEFGAILVDHVIKRGSIVI